VTLSQTVIDDIKQYIKLHANLTSIDGLTVVTTVLTPVDGRRLQDSQAPELNTTGCVASEGQTILVASILYETFDSVDSAAFEASVATLQLPLPNGTVCAPSTLLESTAARPPASPPPQEAAYFAQITQNFVNTVGDAPSYMVVSYTAIGTAVFMLFLCLVAYMIQRTRLAWRQERDAYGTVGTGAATGKSLQGDGESGWKWNESMHSAFDGYRAVHTPRA